VLLHSVPLELAGFQKIFHFRRILSTFDRILSAFSTSKTNISSLRGTQHFEMSRPRPIFNYSNRELPNCFFDATTLSHAYVVGV
jgi:hypothetical protein